MQHVYLSTGADPGVGIYLFPRHHGLVDRLTGLVPPYLLWLILIVVDLFLLQSQQDADEL